MKNLACKTIAFAAALVSTSAINNVSFASELSTEYGFVGFEPQVELSAPFGPAKVIIYDHDQKLLVSEELSAGAVVMYTAQDLGLSGLCYVRIVSTKVVVCHVSENPTDSEWGSTAPQSKLFDTYSMACPAPNNSNDDFFRIFAPQRTLVSVFDQHRRMVAEIFMNRGEVREFSAGKDWGLSSGYAVVIRATKPIAVSFLDGPSATSLMIPQGSDSLP
jgi:hypothetical protein